MTFAGVAVMLIGAGLGLLASIGLVRLPTPLARIHAAAKPASLGLALIAIGAGLTARSWPLAAIGVLVAGFQFVTAPVAGHLLGKSVAEQRKNIEAGAPLHGSGGAVRRRWPLVLQSSLIWVILWRDFTLANLLAGIAVGLALSLLVGPRRSPETIRVRGVLLTGLEYAVSLVRSNIRMARQVVRMSPEDLEETIVYSNLETRSISVALFDANAISFSPGTLTLEMSDDAPYGLVVHALGRSRREVDEEVAHLEASGSRMYTRPDDSAPRS